MTYAVSEKDPTEIVPILFDFTLALAAGETISSASCVVTVDKGIDPSPATVKQGSAFIASPKVTQWVQGGLDGVNYHVKCTALTSLSQTLVLAAILPVKIK